MTTVLENRGYIERVKGTENFVVTNRLFAIGMQNPAKRSLIEVAGAPMRELAESINQSCHLAVASGNQIGDLWHRGHRLHQLLGKNRPSPAPA